MNSALLGDAVQDPELQRAIRLVDRGGVGADDGGEYTVRTENGTAVEVPLADIDDPTGLALQYLRERTRGAALRNERERRALDRETESWVPADELDKQLTIRAHGFSRELASAANRLAPLVAGRTDIIEVQTLIREELDELCDRWYRRGLHVDAAEAAR